MKRLCSTSALVGLSSVLVVNALLVGAAWSAALSCAPDALLEKLAKPTPDASGPAPKDCDWHHDYRAPVFRPADNGGDSSPDLCNLTVQKAYLKAYMCSKLYPADLEEDLKPAKDYLDQFPDRKSGPETNLALVLDIDETSLSNYKQMAANDFAYFSDAPCPDVSKAGPCGSLAFDESMQAVAIPATLELFQKARQKGIAVFFITGRTESPLERMVTERNLRLVGYDGFKRLFMRPAYGYDNVQTFKSQTRALIESKAWNYKIIANVGDQWSDLNGDSSGRPFKVRNRFYLIPGP